MTSAVSDSHQTMERLREGLYNVALKLGMGVDASGRPYDWMFDCRELLLKPPYLHLVAAELWRRLKPYRPDRVGGLTLAANPLTIALLYEAERDGYPLEGFIIRREPKENGLKKLVEGPPLRPGDRVVLVDDLVNSGGTQRQAIKALDPFQVEVVAVGTILNYQRTGEVWLASREIALESLFTQAELGMNLRSPSHFASHRLAWCLKDWNHGRYAAPKSGACFGSDFMVIGSDKGHVACLGVDGTERWRFQVRDTERGVHSTPLLFDDKVFFGSYDGSLYALEAASGALVWERRLGQWIGSSPAADPSRNLVFVGVERGEAQGRLVALDATSGEEVWSLEARHYVHSSPCFDAPRSQVLVGANDSALRAADAATGALNWIFPTQGEVKGNPTVDAEGRCFFGSHDGHLYALDAGTGKLLWKQRLGRSVYFTPLVFEDLIIAGGSSKRLLAFERASGRIRWVSTAGDRWIGGACRLGDDRVVAGAMDGMLYVLEGRTGALVDQFSAHGGFMSIPACGHGRVIAANMDGTLYAIEPSAHYDPPHDPRA